MANQYYNWPTESVVTLVNVNTEVTTTTWWRLISEPKLAKKVETKYFESHGIRKQSLPFGLLVFLYHGI